MTAPDPQWYRKIWTLDIKTQSWVEETKAQVDFLVRAMGLRGAERVLDLACGYGRHSLELASRGFEVTGVDITPSYIEDAKKSVEEKRLRAEFLCADIRDLRFRNEFDVVLNLADGAVGYLENDEENLKIFDRVAEALVPGGKHFMDVCSRDHAEKHFPKRHWEIGSSSIAHADFSWDASSRRMLFRGWDIPFGKPVEPPASLEADSSVRLYGKEELRAILAERGLTVLGTWSDYSGKPDSDRELQLMVYSQKNTARE